MADELYHCGKKYNNEGYHILQKLLCDLIESTKDNKVFKEKLSNFRIDKNIFKYLINRNILYIPLNKNYLELIIKNISVDDIYDFLFIKYEDKTKARFGIEDTTNIIINYDFDIHQFSENASEVSLDYVKIGLENFSGVIHDKNFIINVSTDFSLGVYLLDNDKDMNLEYFNIIKLYYKKGGSFIFDMDTEKIRDKIKMYYDFLDVYKDF